MNSLYKTFLSRVNLSIWIFVVIVLIIVLQNTLAEEIKIGATIPRNVRGAIELALTNQVWLLVKVAVLVPIIVFWLFDKRKLLRISLLISLGLLTIELTCSIAFLVISLTSDTARNAVGLIRDTITVALINILTFSLWYWIVDAYPLQPRKPEEIPSDFLFPQYEVSAAKFADWQPQYMDYLFLAFTTTTAFSPTDTLPLTHRAKALMMIQALFSLVIIVVLAGRALSILR